MLSIRLFGSPQVEVSGRPVQTDRRKAVALLAYLAVTGQPAGRDHLAALFWPDFDSGRAYAYLRRTLWELGQALGEGCVQAGREQVALDPRLELWLDVARFQSLTAPGAENAPAERAARLSEAAALYRGDFMAGFALRDSPEFDAWQVEQSESLRRQLGETLAELSRTCAGLGEADAAVAQARRWLALDNLNEEAHRWLMELYALTGQRSAALRQYETCARVLSDELGIEPEPATRALAERIRRGELQPSAAVETRTVEASALPARTALEQPERQAPAAVSALPRPGTAFVGREQEMEEIQRLLADPDCRLLTLVGPGGIGKTRLAIQSAQGQAAAFAGGSSYVSLAPVTAPELVVPTIAAALSVKFKRATTERDPELSPTAQLCDYLREKELLLVLDNFEHLIAAAGTVSELLAAAPGLKVLVTSRERLNLPEEWTLAVQGMPYPQDEQAPLEAYGAVRLFLQAARQTQVGFEPGEADQRAIARICRLVDGMPLGIVLAASWVRVLSCPEIAAEIEHSLDFLSTSRQGIPERHRNLRAVFDHSWQLLSEYERDVFRKLSIFQGGFRREAAAQVAGASLGLLSALVDKSLVWRGPDGRYALHEMLKRYAAEKLDEVPQQKAEAHQAFHHYYLALYRDQAEALKGAAQKEALAQLEIEADNLRAAWLLTVEIGDLEELEQGLISLFVIYEFGARYNIAAALLEPLLKKLRALQGTNPHAKAYAPALALTLALLSRYYYRVFEKMSENIAYFKEALRILPGLPAGRTKAYVYLALGFGVSLLSTAELRANYQECMRLFEEGGDEWGRAAAMVVFADVMSLEPGYVDEMHALAQEALGINRSLGNRWAMANCYFLLAMMDFWMGNFEQAIRYGQEARSIYEEFNERWRVAETLLQLGRIETDRGHYAEARSYYLENIAFSQEMGARYTVAVNQECLGYVELLTGNLDLAEQYYRSGLEIYRQIELRHGEGMALGNLGDVAMARRAYEQARSYYLESLDVLGPVREEWGKSVDVKKLGQVALLMGNYPEAEETLQRALEMSRQLKRTPDIQEVLTLQAALKLKTGHPAEARRLLEGVLAHPATTPTVKQRAAELLNSAKSK